MEVKVLNPKRKEAGNNGTLRGSFELEFVGFLTIRSMLCHYSDGRYWICPPAIRYSGGKWFQVVRIPFETVTSIQEKIQDELAKYFGNQDDIVIDYSAPDYYEDEGDTNVY